MAGVTVVEVDRVTFPGRYQGEGSWLDIAGESKRYRVTQEISESASALVVRYAHEFFEEGTSTEGEFVFEFVSPTLFTTSMKGAAAGNGYVFERYLHFNIRAGDIFVETSYQRVGDALLVRGSSTSNAQGRFIAWSEVLERMS
jgi:hypothetical protein